MPGVFRDTTRHQTDQHRTRLLEAAAAPPEGGSGGIRNTWRQSFHEAVENPLPISALQVGLGFKLHLSMDMSEEMTGEAAPLTDNVHPFCLSFHLKGVCNSNFGGRHANQCLPTR